MSTIEFDGARINIAESGHGKPVVLLHSSASSSGQWHAISDTLASSRIFAPDMFGCGGSDEWHGLRPYSLAEEAKTVEAIANIAGQPIHLVGHSFGGAVALRYALRHPDQIASLTLIEPVAFHLLKQRGYFDRTLFAEIKIVANAVFDAVIDGAYESGMSCFVDYWNGEGSWSRLGHRRQRAFAAMAVQVARQFSAATNEHHTLDSYRKIHAPTMIIRGGCSPTPARRIAQLLAGTIPNARLQSYRSAGHMLPITHPETIAALIAEQVGESTELLLEAA